MIFLNAGKGLRISALWVVHVYNSENTVRLQVYKAWHKRFKTLP